MIKNLVLTPLSMVFTAATKIREQIYAQGLIEKTDVGVPVVSVGNLTVGGTGKTPTVDFLLRHLSARGISVGVVSRGYRALNPGPVSVTAQGKDLSRCAEEFGDEPTMIKWRNPQVPVVIGRQRVEACRLLIKNHPDTKIILADDAFQHWRLRRNLDVVVLDATEKPAAYRALPLGKARESFSALSRAHFVVINKTNLGTAQNIEFLTEQLKSYPHIKTLRFKYRISGLRGLKSGEPQSEIKTQKYFLISGIGRSSTFKELVGRDLGINIVGEFQFPDHFSYEINAIEKIMIQARKQGADRILMTEKDAVKFQRWAHDEFVYTELEMVPESSLEMFDEKISSLIR